MKRSVAQAKFWIWESPFWIVFRMRRRLHPTAACGFALRLGLALCPAFLTTTGCKKSAVPITAKPVVPAGTATIRGSVSFAGVAPELKPIPGATCHKDVKPAFDNALVVDAAGKVQNVIVYLKDGPNVDLPAEPVVLDQVDCRYEPRVVAVRAGKVLRVKSSDPTIHNVHGMCNANPQFNFGMTGAGETKDITFSLPEPSPVRMKCDVHPWMAGHVGVFDHPFFAVTGPDGTFQLKQVPAGTYTLVAWHERLGTSEQPITVVEGQPASAEFTFGNAASPAK